MRQEPVLRAGRRANCNSIVFDYNGCRRSQEISAKEES